MSANEARTAIGRDPRIELDADGSTVVFRGRPLRLVTATEHYGSLVNLAVSRPAPGLVAAEPEGCCVVAAQAGNGEGSDTVVFYVATEAEVELVEGYRPAVGGGRLEVARTLSGADICYFSPATGRYFGWHPGRAGGSVIELPPFVEDLAVVGRGAAEPEKGRGRT